MEKIITSKEVEINSPVPKEIGGGIKGECP